MTNEEIIKQLKTGKKFFCMEYEGMENLKDLYFFKYYENLHHFLLFQIDAFTVATGGDFEKENNRIGGVQFNENHMHIFNFIGNKRMECKIFYNEIEFENDEK